MSNILSRFVVDRAGPEYSARGSYLK